MESTFYAQGLNFIAASSLWSFFAGSAAVNMGAQGDQTKPCGFVVPLFLFPVQYFEGSSRERQAREERCTDEKKSHEGTNN